MSEAIKAVKDMVIYYSIEPEPFDFYPKQDSYIKDITDKFVKANYKRLRKNKYIYTG